VLFAGASCWLRELDADSKHQVCAAGIQRQHALHPAQV